MTVSRRAFLADIATYVAYVVIFLFFAGPLLWLLSLAVRNASEVYVSEIRILPREPTLSNFVDVLGNPLFPIYLWNGLKLAVAGAFGALLFATPAAYALSRFRFRRRNLVMIGLLAFQMISPLVIMVPLYRFGAFLRVVLPLSLPGLTSAFVLNAILGWSQFIIPFILLSKPELLPISVGIFNFQGTYSQTSTQLLAAASVISIVPAIVVFLVLQRLIVGALTAGAVKG